MMKEEITIVVPIKEEPELVTRFYNENYQILEEYPLIIIDSGGGEIFEDKSRVYVNKDLSLGKARRLGITLVNTEYILNLDVDVIVPRGYLELSKRWFDSSNEIGAISLDYEELQGHLAFGQSIWRTELLKDLYSWNSNKKVCECMYMWSKLRRNGYLLETLNMRCKHIKEMKEA